MLALSTILNMYPGTTAAQWAQHPVNMGGGWKMTTATVAATAYLGPNAQVIGNGQVLDTARVDDQAVVGGYLYDANGYSTPFPAAIVSLRAKVFGQAQIQHTALITDDAQVFGTALIPGYGLVADAPFPPTGVTTVVSGNAQVGGKYVYLGLGLQIGGNAVLGSNSDVWMDAGGAGDPFSARDGSRVAGRLILRGTLSMGSSDPTRYAKINLTQTQSFVAAQV